MAFNLPVNIGELYGNFFDSLLQYFPENFSEIPAIKEVENLGVKLVAVRDELGHKIFKPEEFRGYMRECVLGWGEIDHGMPSFTELEYGPNSFVFEKGSKKYEVHGDVTLKTVEISIDLNEKDLEKLRREVTE